ncbi:MAG TPA: acyl-CoA dehydrogenase family protein [Solirubrobacteraceae bacterium]|jgi:alkylation response protein AidB-like acyl-CoA dehydrogenase|nr:acyl-CoA dehydrogenase family protein [Solirubrobacteraceae bacterium]
MAPAGAVAEPVKRATLAAAGELLALVRERADEVERAGLLGPELLEALAGAGCLRMAVPARHGGEDLSLGEVLAVVETLAQADAAVAWTVGQVALSQVMLGYLPEAAREQIYADTPDALVAGAAAPKGRAERIDGGWRVSGQWPLVSGCEHARWIFLQCVAVEDRQVMTDAGGLPRMRMVVLPAGEVEIVRTWDAVGLRGTGSHDVRVSHVVAPEGLTAELAAGAPAGAAILRVAPPAQGGTFVAATLAGIGAGALSTVRELAAGGKRSAFSPTPLAESPLFGLELGDATITLEAARGLLVSEVERADALARDGRVLAASDRARLRAAAVKVAALAVGVIDTAYTLAGSSSLYTRSPLQRRLRDAHAATQHFTVGRELYSAHGALLAGAELAHPAFV